MVCRRGGSRAANWLRRGISVGLGEPPGPVGLPSEADAASSWGPAHLGPGTGQLIRSLAQVLVDALVGCRVKASQRRIRILPHLPSSSALVGLIRSKAKMPAMTALPTVVFGSAAIPAFLTTIAATLSLIFRPEMPKRIAIVALGRSGFAAAHFRSARKPVDFSGSHRFRADRAVMCPRCGPVVLPLHSIRSRGS